MSGKLIEPQEMDPNRPVMIFVFGLISIIACQIFGPIAFLLGQKYRQECRERGIEPDGLATAGWVMGIVGSIFLLLGLVFFLIYFGFACMVFVFYIIAMFGVVLAA